MMSWQLSTPTTELQWQQYYELRYQVLRAPWGQPRGSERDELEVDAFHAMVQEQGQVLAVGRLHRLADGRAQVRYMAVSEAARGRGFGAIVLARLEQQAVQWGCGGIVLNARENAVGFYKKQHYLPGAVQPPLYGIPHHQMHKTLRMQGEQSQWQDWCHTLQNTWHQTIPLSAFMQLQIHAFDGYQLQCQAPLAPNINLHQTMFAGSIYTLLTLTGWGLVYLQLQALQVQGDIVLADADVRYLKPVTDGAIATARLMDVDGELSPLIAGRRARQSVLVELHHQGLLLASFRGRFAVLPRADA